MEKEMEDGENMKHKGVTRPSLFYLDIKVFNQQF